MTIGPIHHIAVVVRSIEASLPRYGELFGLDRSLNVVRGIADGILLVAVRKRRQGSAKVVDVPQLGERTFEHGARQRLDVVRAGQWIDGRRDSRLVIQHLLCSQREARGVRGREAERLVERVGVE